ncbi:LPXTG cell wall anchor domain-containing protein [Faecalitalea cylindroides]|uniref:LPXTG cell wall anchor domain-containing protein n=1 Tax=Faecalitalea cylindroides TaxID=39483 RepID=A0AAW6FVB4_9FIRM|nr:LPXTG cell wall anchor domain-containing protein [Faecalitalea cylindroides]MDC0828845.1 LPXTG cell wall anchor domain-containing protein [Faecalitalea cylindroides]
MKNLFKKLALGLGTATAICMSLTPAFAAGSITSNGSTSGEVIRDGVVLEGSTSQFVDDLSYLTSSENEQDVKAADIIEQLNAGTPLTEAFSGETVALPEGVEIDLSEFSLLTKLQDLQAFDADGNRLEENVTISWEVPNLTSELGEVYVLHYSTKADKGWEVIKPDEVNYDTKMITATFEDLSPVGVIYKSTENVPAENPNTSTSTNAGLYLGVGAVALVAIGLIVFKKHKA